LRGSLGADFTQELVEDRHSLVAATLGVDAFLSGVTLSAQAQQPLTQARRFEHRLLLSATVPLGESL